MASELAHVVELACLELADEELEALSADVRRILGFVDAVTTAAVDGAPPHEPGARLRVDAAQPCDAPPLVGAAPAAVDGWFVLPRTTE